MLDVLIVGAGPSGLVAALVLAQNGIKNIRVIDKIETFQVGSRGFGVQPRSLELFKMFGILDDVMQHSTPVPTFRAYKPGEPQHVKEWDLYPKSKPWPDRPFTGQVCLSQDDLEAALRARLATYGIYVQLGKGLTAIEQDDDGVTATLAAFKNKEETGEKEVVKTKYLFGCDGARGASRKLLGLTFEGETKDADGQVWGDVEIEGLSTDFWHIWGVPGKFTIMLRPRDYERSPSSKNFSVGITGHSFDPADLQLDVPEKLEAWIRECTGRPELKFRNWTWLSKFKPNMRMVNTFQSGRAFCVGDSAHVHSPTGGQGMNNGIQDALNISWKTALVLKGLSSPELLKTYNEERLPIIALMLQATTNLYTAGMVARVEARKELPSGTAPKDTKPASADDDRKTGWLRWRNDALELYGVNYRFSSLVYDDRTPLGTDQDAKDVALARAYAGYEGLGTLAAGDRLPDASGLVSLSGSSEKEWALLDLFDTSKHTVLIFAPDGDTSLPGVLKASRLCGLYPNDIVQTVILFPPGSCPQLPPDNTTKAFVDGDGHARSVYRVGDEMAVAVARPDGYVGAIVMPKDVQRHNGEDEDVSKGLTTYFGKVFDWAEITSPARYTM
ncbi:hypothetical protein EIP91_003647 [Steccherinum ochraceum]|uniref:FAD-binding domain-containing protein n=1 Tax=Steccherinum ochraceum TaxID=92696 RepID=A0A4R0RCM3_9APHY|nr:hypothetical protein EIP91_003647 [Steccherinum ochraceum]